MAKVIITQDYLEDIADAIREKTGLSDTYKPSEMAPAIMTISGGGGIVPSGTTSITSNGTYNVSTYAVADVDVDNSYVVSDQGKVVSNGALVSQSAATYTQNSTYDTTLVNSVTVDVESGGGSGGSVSLQDKTVSITPSSSAQTQVVSADSGYDGLDEVTINVSATPTSNDFVVTINNVSGVYTPNKTFAQIVDAYEDDKNVVFICDDFSPVTAFYDQEEAMIFCTILVRQEDSEERAYIEQRVYTYTSQSWSLTNTESVYYTDITTATVAEVAAGAIFVNEDGYVEGTATRRSSSDLSASGAIVTAPAGYYSSASTKAVTAGSEGTPVATKGTVSNHSISVTPSVINTAGYIIGGTKTGTAVSVSASELVSGTYSITGTGNSNVTNYAYASVSAGSAGTPTATKGTVSNHSVSITPSVTNTTGWITGSTKTGTAVSVSASELVSGSTTLTSNGTYDITNFEEAIINVPTGGGGASNFVSSTFTTKSTGASTETITVPYTGTGYPIGLVITIQGGAYNSSISPWYNSTTRYAVGQWSAFKSIMTSTPTYGTSGSQNQAVTAWIYKNSTSTATSYSRSSAMTTYVYNSGNATGSGANCVRIKSSTSFQYITGNGGSSSYGLLASQTYRYYMIYSS